MLFYSEFKGLSSVQFYSVLFSSVLFSSVLFCSVLFCSVLFCSIPFRSVQFSLVQFLSFPYRSVPFRSVPFSSQLTMKQPGRHVGSWCTDRRNNVSHSERQPPSTPLSCCLPQHLTECKHTCSSPHLRLTSCFARIMQNSRNWLLAYCSTAVIVSSSATNMCSFPPLAPWFNVAWCSH